MAIDDERDLSTRLREWDPALRHPPPDASSWKPLRSRLRGSPEELPPAWRPPLVTATVLAAAGLVAFFLSPSKRDGSSPARPLGPPSTIARLAQSLDSVPLEIQLVSSNGTRIYWSIPPSPTSRQDDYQEAQ